MNKFTQYNILAEVFKYPSDQFTKNVGACVDLFQEHYPDALSPFGKFAEWATITPLHEMEEVYTKTFHIQAICYLDLGFVIFGEDYKRGEFLVNMKGEQQTANNDCGDELPDNLINVLTLMPKIQDESFRNELAVRIVIPSIHKMLDEFKSARMELKTKVLRKKHKAILLENQKNGNIYQHALRALLLVVETDFEGIHYEEPKHSTSGFEAAACGSSCSFINTKTTKTVRS